MTGLTGGSRRVATSGRAAGPVRGVAVPVAERGGGRVTGRVAEPPGGAHRRRAGVVGVGDGELGRTEDRFARALAELGSCLREPPILALVVLDDPVDA